MLDTSTIFRKEIGTYAIVLQLIRTTTMAVGKLGPVSFNTGYYMYIGSAFGPGGLAARIGRHLKPSKKCHWHIDYLRRIAEIREIWYTLHPAKVECRWTRLLKQTRTARVVCPAFGSSDCGCDTHLFHFKRKPGIKTFRRKVGTQLTVKELRVD